MNFVNGSHSTQEKRRQRRESHLSHVDEIPQQLSSRRHCRRCRRRRPRQNDPAQDVREGDDARTGWMEEVGQPLVARISVSTRCNQRTTPIGAMLAPFRPLRQLHPRVTHWRGTLNSPPCPLAGMLHSSPSVLRYPSTSFLTFVLLLPAPSPPKFLLLSLF